MHVDVHHMHIGVKHKCALTELENAISRAHQSCMKHTIRRKTYLREWRKTKPGRTLEMVAEQLHISRTQLGRIEKGQQPYNQDLLEALAHLYGCDVPDLLMRDPTDPEGMWSLWDHAKPGERQQIRSLAETVLKFRDGTGG